MTTVNNSIIKRTILLLIAVCLLSIPTQAQYGGGEGTAENPYLIYTAEQMNTIGTKTRDWNKHFKLMADIDLSSFGTEFNIIGTSVGRRFSGVFDGDGHSISNFECGAPDVYSIGLFGCVNGQNAEIKNLRLIDPVVHAETKDNVGALIGFIYNGTVTACSVENGIIIGNESVGGLAGSISNDGTITECFSIVIVSGDTKVGGLVGNSYGEIMNCYSNGNVSGNEKVGGLIGQGSISNCYSTALVSGTKSVGGLVGNTYRTKWSFWDIETSGQTNSGGGTGLTTAQMQTASTYIGYWGNDPVWTIDEGVDYPRLAWQNMPGELIIKPNYAEGSGTEADPYLIYTAEQLNMIGLFPCDWDKNFKLMADIDLSKFTETEFNIIGYRIGSLSPDNEPFRGVFDGNGRTISNFTYSSTEWELYIGIFGYIERATLEHIYLIDPNIDVEKGTYVGSLVGWSSGTINTCYVQGGIVSGEKEVGGLVGDNSGIIHKCASNTEITGYINIGGLAGNNHGRITECTSKAAISGNEAIGGLVGFNSSGTICNCYSLNNVTGITSVGGLVGKCGSQASIINNYSVGCIQGTENVGGLIGSNGQNNVLYCFWDIETSEQVNSAGGEGKTTAEMQTASTFIGWGPYAVWTITEGLDYPRLLWENMPGELLTTISFPTIEGSGTQDDPYLIYTAEQFNLIGLFPLEWDKHYKLMSDIDLAGYTSATFNTIGCYTRYPVSGDKPFSGVFDGNEYAISNFNYTGSGGGIFDRVEDAEIKDLGFIDPNVSLNDRGDRVGLLAGWLLNSTITNCYVQGGSVSGTGIVGGLVGDNYGGTITNSYFQGSVYGSSGVGGLVCWNRGIITNCHFSGEVSGTGTKVGGLVGDNSGSINECSASAHVSGINEVGGLVGEQWSGRIMNCYTDGSVSGEEQIGGLIGRNNGVITNCYTTSDVSGVTYTGGFAGRNGYNPSDVVWHGNIYNCYARGNVIGEEYVGGFAGNNDYFGLIYDCYSTGNVLGVEGIGGLVGQNRQGDIINSFWDMETSGLSTSAAGTGKTTAQMQELNTFFVWGGDAVWKIDEGSDYPRLVWEEMPGVPITKSSYGGGSGTETDPYLIYTAEQLNEIGLFTCDFDKHFKLMADINLSTYSGTDFNIIGFYAGNHNYNNIPFTGVFDGNGHTISNFTYVSTDKDRIGLFVYLDDPNAQIKNLGLIDPNINAGPGYHTGSLVGIVQNGSIVSCFVEGGYVSGDWYVGGLVGSCYGNIQDCDYSGTVTGNHNVGGLAGRFSSDGMISDSTTIVTVTGSWAVGGLVGDNYGRKLMNCCTTGTVTGDQRIGGLVGNYMEGEISDCNSGASVQGGVLVGGLAGASWSTIIQCCANGSVSGNHDLGGLVGYNGGSLVKSYAKGSVTGNAIAGGLVGTNLDTISDCYSTGGVSGVNDGVGGLVGLNSWDGATITGSYATGNVVGTDSVGGLVGFNDYAISKCYSTGDVSGVDDVGGLVGKNSSDSPITECYSSSSVDGNDVVGGLVGKNYSTITNSYSRGPIVGNKIVGGLVGYNYREITNCYSASNVSGIDDIGGFVGDNSGGSIIGCFWNVETSELTNSDGGFGKKIAEMQTSGTFLDAGWDFVDETENGTDDIWWILEGQDYPRLWWEIGDETSL